MLSLLSSFPLVFAFLTKTMTARLSRNVHPQTPLNSRLHQDYVDNLPVPYTTHGERPDGVALSGVLQITLLMKRRELLGLWQVLLHTAIFCGLLRGEGMLGLSFTATLRGLEMWMRRRSLEGWWVEVVLCVILRFVRSCCTTKTCGHSSEVGQTRW